METKMNRNGWWMIFLLVILFACLVSGCPKSKEAVAPGTEGMKETPKSDAAPKSEQEPTSKPAPVLQHPRLPPNLRVPTQQKAPPLTPEATEDLIASGEVLLNPAFPQDAEKIQSRRVRLQATARNRYQAVQFF